MITEEQAKTINKMKFYSEERFISDCKTYIKALQSGRLRYQVMSVSASGMNRTIHISSYEGTMAKGHYRIYSSMLKVLGYNSTATSTSETRVKGCGMDMCFRTNYNIVHKLFNMKLITKKKCDRLAQAI